MRIPRPRVLLTLVAIAPDRVPQSHREPVYFSRCYYASIGAEPAESLPNALTPPAQSCPGNLPPLVVAAGAIRRDTVDLVLVDLITGGEEHLSPQHVGTTLLARVYFQASADSSSDGLVAHAVALRERRSNVFRVRLTR